MSTPARPFVATFYSGLKQAAKQWVKRCFDKQAVAAEVTRVGQQAISDYGSTAPENADKHMPIDVLLDLTRASGDFGLLKHIAESVDCLLVPMPEGFADHCLVRGMGRSAKEFGEVMVHAAEAMADGVVTAAEARQLMLEIREAMIELASMAQAVRGLVREET